MELDNDTSKLVIEIISTLVYIKSTMAELILRPAGVPDAVIREQLYRRDPVTGEVLSKRKIAPGIISDVCARSDGAQTMRRIIEIAANWSSYHLAKDELLARAVVQKARQHLGVLEAMEVKERQDHEAARQQEIARMEKERAGIIERESRLLLMMFEELARSEDHQGRGILLQDLLNRVFQLYEIPITRSYTRNAGGEQIDGAFRLEGWHYLVECRWRERLSNVREVDGLLGQVTRSGKQTMGVFFSINGWSDNVPQLLKQNSEKCLLLVEGYALRCALTRELDLRDYLLASIANLNLRAEPHLSVRDYLASVQ